MPTPIQITIEAETFEAELNDTATARRLHEALPIEGNVSRWGDEIYFMTRVDGDASEADRSVLEVGDLAFWPPGQAFCIFFGPTPMSQGTEPRAASEVVHIGRIRGDINLLRQSTDGELIRLER
jgi:hypothetical protein